MLQRCSHVFQAAADANPHWRQQAALVASDPSLVSQVLGLTPAQLETFELAAEQQDDRPLTEVGMESLKPV